MYLVGLANLRTIDTEPRIHLKLIANSVTVSCADNRTAAASVVNHWQLTPLTVRVHIQISALYTAVWSYPNKLRLCAECR